MNSKDFIQEASRSRVPFFKVFSEFPFTNSNFILNISLSLNQIQEGKQNWDLILEIYICECKTLSKEKDKKCSYHVLKYQLHQTCFSKTEKLNDSSEILLIKKHKSSHKGETFSHWKNKCNKVSGNFLQKLQLGESSRPILWRNWFLQIALWKSLK